MTSLLKFTSIVFLLNFCEKPHLQLFDNEHEKLVWSQDTCGCSGERRGLQMQVLMRLWGMNRMDVECELGKPLKIIPGNCQGQIEAYYPVSSLCDSAYQVAYPSYLVVEYEKDIVIRGAITLGGRCG